MYGIADYTSPVLSRCASYLLLSICGSGIAQHGDVYVLGLGLTFNEFDLWWLIHRKQRERYSDGKIFFYERKPQNGYESKHLLMQANGVILCDAGCDDTISYDSFYCAALEDIRRRISESRKVGT